MGIAEKLTVGLGAVTLLALGWRSYIDLRREEADLRASTEHEIRLVGTALQVGFEQALRDGQEADIGSILAALEVRDSALDIFEFDRNGRLAASSWGSRATIPLAERIVAKARTSNRPVVEFRGEDHLIAAFPMNSSDGSRGEIIAVVRPLDDVRADLARTRRSTLASIVVMVVAISLAGAGLIAFQVRRPLRAMVDAMRIVRRGDFTASVPAGRADEVGAAAREFNAMIRALEDTRRRLAAESQTREALEIGLHRVDRLVTVGQLSAGLAHEIGSPLQILSGRAEALLARPDLSADVRRNVEILARQSDRITRIVEQLLSFARRKVPHFAEVEITPLVKPIVDLLDGEAHRRGVSLELLSPAVLPRIVADADQIQQVVLNLVTNALRACAAGARVRVALTEASFRHGDRGRERHSVMMSVEDNGTGMTEEVLSRVFEPFFTTCGDLGGTGLGLAVVKKIVTDHEGLVTVTSRPGDGTRFTVHFPTVDTVGARRMSA